MSHWSHHSQFGKLILNVIFFIFFCCCSFETRWDERNLNFFFCVLKQKTWLQKKYWKLWTFRQNFEHWDSLNCSFMPHCSKTLFDENLKTKTFFHRNIKGKALSKKKRNLRTSKKKLWLIFFRELWWENRCKVIWCCAYFFFTGVAI
jgi:hypothetical protein